MKVDIKVEIPWRNGNVYEKNLTCPLKFVNTLRILTDEVTVLQKKTDRRFHHRCQWKDLGLKAVPWESKKNYLPNL